MSYKLWIESYRLIGDEGFYLKADIRPATVEEVDRFRSMNPCACTLGRVAGAEVLFYDEAGWMYDTRVCGVCGKGLGVV